MPQQQTLKFTIRQDGYVTEEASGFGTSVISVLKSLESIEEETWNFRNVEKLNQNTINLTMSHFSRIKTKIKNKPELEEALVLLQYDVKEDQELKVTGAHGIKHERV